MRAVAVTAWLMSVALIVGGIALLGFALSPSPAPAQAARCFPADAALASLREAFGEAPAYRAVTKAGDLLVITVNPGTGSWSAVLQPDSRLACLVASGDGWDAVAPAPVPEARS